MGIADVGGAESERLRGGSVAQRLVTGEGDLAIDQLSEFLAVKGAVLVGPLPAEIQSYTVYTGGLAPAARDNEAGNTFPAFLRSDHARRIPAEKGMEEAPA